MKNFLKQCPLVVFILISTMGLTIYALVGVLAGKYNFKVSMTETVFSAVLKHDYKEDAMLVDNDTEHTMEGEEGDTSNKKPPILPEDDKTLAEKPDIPEDSSDNTEVLGSPTKYMDREKRKPRSPYYDDPGKIALTTDYGYKKVDKSYFDDALFVGDSRIEGMSLYSGLDNADFHFKDGLTVYKMMTEKLLDTKHQQETLEQTLSKKQYGKIYMMIGINELGIKTSKDFAMQYKANLDRIRQLQPNAVIFIMGIMNVTDEYSQASDVYNNDNINSKNVAIAGFANGIDTFYFDINPVVSDDLGGIKKEYTWDGIHLKAQYYSLIVDFLLEHGLKVENTAT